MPRRFTVRDIQVMFANPVYVGIGPYQQIITDELWVSTALIAIHRRGANYWRDVQASIINCLDLTEEKASAICMNSQTLYAAAQGDEERKEVLRQLLASLRTNQPPV